MAEQTMLLLSDFDQYKTAEDAANYDDYPETEIAQTSENFTTQFRLVW